MTLRNIHAIVPPMVDPSLLPTRLGQRAARQGWLKWAILLSSCLGAMMETVDTSIVNVAVPDMRGNLGATLSEIGWVSTGYTMANVIIIPLTAWLGMQFGKKSYFLFSLASFTFASVLCGMSNSLGMLIAARVFQGLAGGGLLAKAQSLLFETFPREEQGQASAIFGLGVIVGPAIGPTLGGLITDGLDWRWIFFINVPIGLLAIWMIYTFLPEDDQKARMNIKGAAVDWWGILWLTLGLGTFQMVLEQGQQEDWFGSSFIRWSTAISLLSLVLFVRRELTTRHPAVDLRVLRHKALMAGSLYSIVLGFGLYGAVFIIPVFAQAQLHFTATKTGLLLMPGALASAVVMILFGKFLKDFDQRVLITAGALILCLSMWILGGLSPASNEDTLFWPLIGRGVGTALIFLPLSIAALGGISRHEIPAASGLFSLTRQMGGSIGIAVLTTMLEKFSLIHRGELVQHITPLSVPFQQRSLMANFAMSPQVPNIQVASQKALGIFDNIVTLQSSVLASIDIFQTLSWMFLLTLPLILLLSRGGVKPGGAH
jgi:DHA2 family multidrug resistance protein